MLRIDRYIMQQFLAGLVPVMFLLLALFSFLALAEELEDVGQGAFTMPDAFMVVFLTTPKRIVELLPVTALLGGLLGLGAMANQRELIAIRTSGMSKGGIAKVVTLLAALLSVFIAVLQFTVVPGFEREAAQLRGKALQDTEQRSDKHGGFWTRDGDQFIHIKEVRYDRALIGVEVYTVDETGSLSQLIQASRADYIAEGNWQLSGLTHSKLDNTHVDETHKISMQWKNLLSPEQAAVFMLPLEALAPSDLANMIMNLRRNKLDTHQYEIVFWQQLSLLPALFAMALLSLPFLLGSVRAVSASQRIMIGGLIGIGFYLIQQLSGHLAGILGMNPALVILAPPFLVLAVAIAAIRHRNL